MTIFILSLLIPILGFLAGLYQIPKDMQIPKSEFGVKNKWHRLNHKGRRYVTISFFAALILEVGLIIKGPENNKTVPGKKQLDRMVVFFPKVVTNTRVIEKKMPRQEPVMDINIDSTKVVGTLPDKISLQFAVGCINNEIAYHIMDSVIGFAVVNNTFMPLGKISRSTDSTWKSYNNKGMNIFATVTQPRVPNIADTTYFLLKVRYSDKEAGDSKEFILKMLFYSCVDGPPQKLTDIVFKRVGDQQKYAELKELLIKNKKW